MCAANGEGMAGYARTLATAMARNSAKKHLFSSPKLKYGQCLGTAAYFMQLGSVLGTMHQHHLDAFGPAFLGVTGPSGAVKTFIDEAIGDVLEVAKEEMSFTTFVLAEQSSRLGHVGEPQALLLEQGMMNLDLVTAVSMFWQFAEAGAILGVALPALARQMFDLSNAKWDEDKWERARAAGLDIPRTQDVVEYAECQREENRAFLAYCEEVCPNLVPELMGT